MAPTNNERGSLPRSRESSERGFTLVEVLVATVILTIGLVSMAEMMAITLRMQMMGKNETSAVRLAQSKIDELVNVTFASATVAVGGSLTSNAAGYFDTPVGFDGVQLGFTRRWQIQAFGTYTNVRTLTVRIIPNLNDRRTNAQIELVTIIRNTAAGTPTYPGL